MGNEQSVPSDDADTDNQSVRSAELPRWDHPGNKEESERHAATQPLPQIEPFSDPPPVEAASPPATSSKKKKKKKRDRGSLGAAMDSPGRSLSHPTPLKRKKTTRSSLGNDENGVPSSDGSASRKLKKTKRMSLAAILNDNADNADANDSQDSFVPPPTLPELRPETQNDEEEEDMEVVRASQRRKSSGKKKKSKKSEPAPEPEVSPEPPAADDRMELDEAGENLANLKAERPDNNSDDDADMEDGPPTQTQQPSETAAPQDDGDEIPSSPSVLIKSEPGVYDDNDEDEVDASRIELEDVADEDDGSPAPAKSERIREVMDESGSAHDSGYVERSGSDVRSRRGLSQVSHALDHDEATPSEDEAMHLVKSAPEGDDNGEMDGTPESEASPSQALKAVPESDNEVEGTPESEAEEELVHKAERESDVEEERMHKAERESDVEEESEVEDEERINDPLESEEESEPEASADEEEAREEEDQEQQADEERASEIPESEPEQPAVQPEHEAPRFEEPRFEPISDAETDPAPQNGQTSANAITARSSPELGGDDAEAMASPSPPPPPPSSIRARSSTKRKAKRAFNPDAPLSEPSAQPEESPIRPQKKQKPAAQAEREQEQVEEQEEGEVEAVNAPTPALKKRKGKKIREVLQEEQDSEPEEPSVPTPSPKKKKTKKIREMLQDQQDGEGQEEESVVPTPAPKKKKAKKIRETLQQQQDGEGEEEVPEASTPAPKKKAKTKKPKKVAANEEEQAIDKSGYATGRLTAVEEDKVTRAVNKFRRDEGLTQEDINKIIHENPAAAANAAKGAPVLHGSLWSAVCEACPTRTRLKLQKFCRRKFNNYVARGQWTAEQDEELQQMIKIHGNKWTHIGGLINRHPQDVRDRWRDYLVCQDKVVKNEWSREEEEELTKAVNEAIDKIRKDLISRGEDGGQAEGLVNWQGISEAMGRTRNRLQCMEKWKRILKAEPVADRDRVVTLLPDNDSWRVKMARQDLPKITPEEKYRLVRTIRDGCAEIEKEIDWRKITERIFKDKYQRLALVVIWGRLRSSVPNHGDKTVHECAQHIVDMYDKDGGFGNSYGDYPDERAAPSSAREPPASVKKGKANSKSRRSSTRSISARNGEKKKELSAAIIVDETDSELEPQPEEDTVMNDAASIASDAPPVDPDEEVEEEQPEEPEEEEPEVANEEEHEEPPQSSVVKRLAPTEDDSNEDDDTRPPFMPSPSVEAEASRTRRRERSLSAKPPTPAAIEEESGEEVQDEDMVTTTRLKSAKKRPAAAEEISPRKKKRKMSEGTTRPAVRSSSSPVATYGRKSNTRKEIKKAAAEAVKARQARALSTISSDMDDMDDIPARLPGQTPPQPTPPRPTGRTTRRAARQ